MAGRPVRQRLPDFAGRLIALPDGPESWQCLQSGKRDILLLGAGPGRPWELPFVAEALANGADVYCLKGPEAVKNLPVPEVFRKQWHEVSECQVSGLAQNCSVYFYKPGLRLAPAFWGPVLAGIELLLCGNPPRKSRLAWLPGNDRLLLHQELRLALGSLGYTDICENQPENDSSFLEGFENGTPGLAISVNFRGLDCCNAFEICRAAGIPLAVWLVDNPWTLLSGINLPWWQEANLFVTDASFIAGLKAAGAKNVWHLPLAASQHMRVQELATESAPVFVGTSAFAKKDSYFAGLKLPAELYAKARAQLAKNILPDFHWWQEHLQANLWPGNGARLPAFGAAEFSALNRARWVSTALPHGLEIYGDAGWQTLLGRPARAPVDYYGCLPQLYTSAGCVLNVTSGLLPQSLNQRHFDVWAAGGFLLTDYTKDLGMFPSDLTEPVALAKPDEFQGRLEWLQKNPQEKKRLQLGWREVMARDHTYAKRLEKILAEIA